MEGHKFGKKEGTGQKGREKKGSEEMKGVGSPKII